MGYPRRDQFHTAEFSVIRRDDWITLIAIVLGLALALTLLAGRYVGGVQTKFDDAAAMGAQTSSVFAKIGEHPIHCQDGGDVEACLNGVAARHAERSALWLGNSQLHAVNQLRRGETNATPILFRKLEHRNLDMVTFSQGNANLQEHYVLFEYLRRRLPLRVLILSVVFDDFREDGLRDGVALFARNDQVARDLSETAIGRRLVNAARSAIKEEGSAIPQPGNVRAISDGGAVAIATPQEQSEHRINELLEQYFPLWRVRSEIRGDIFIGLYKLRNTVFGIKATTKRKMIRGRYANNVAALVSMLDVASREGIGVVLYMAPLRSAEAGIPYVASEYEQFKSEVAALASRYGAVYANLEGLVPEALWGTKDATSIGEKGEFDFMHFNAGGHVLLAEKIDSLVGNLFRVAPK